MHHEALRPHSTLQCVRHHRSDTCNTGLHYIATGSTCSQEIKDIVAEKNSHTATAAPWIVGDTCAAGTDACVQNVADYSCGQGDGLTCEIADGCSVTYNLGMCIPTCEVD